ncbi:hypothetical protein MTZ49_01870 [Entomomonas sp. E2T0]|uniref:hypothetical protein n=1 Tax=Entomomonas sp. E2T0 TaxID=2930213 RepID=UPI0022284DDA|nr:hypothetical protein [Entomomonas sp. E2T0]UYZ84352.1 hypothetical protein MTZ49_01870 [Entomomonas sp. E2T0]
MNDKVNGYCTEIACDTPSFIIQVMGKDHPEEQKLFVMDDQGNKYYPDNKELLEEVNPTRTTYAKGKLLSTLYMWSWENLKDKSGLGAYLEITNTKGTPITFALHMDVVQTPKQYDKQINQIVPIIACTQLHNVDNSTVSIPNSGAPVLAREGYLYMFSPGKLWREIKIEQEEGTLYPIYKDVALSDTQYYDNQELIFKADEREASGAPLKEIWVPSVYNNDDVSSEISFFYSEVQLSAVRINLLLIAGDSVKHPQRTVSLAQDWATVTKDLLKGKELLEASALTYIRPRFGNYAGAVQRSHADLPRVRTTIQKIQSTAFPATEMAPQRGRDHLFENLLDFPSKYIYDESNSYLTDAIAFSREFLDQAKEGNELPNGKILELGALQYTLEQRTQIKAMVAQLLSTQSIFNSSMVPYSPTVNTTNSSVSNENQNEQEKPESVGYFMSSINKVIGEVQRENPAVFNDKKDNSIWDAPSAQPFINALQDAQDRKIYCVCVDDSHYRIRHSVQAASRSQEVMGKMTADIAQRQYFDSALLIQQVVSPRKINDKDNTHSSALNKLDAEGEKKLAYHSGVLERAVIAARYDEVTRHLLTSFQSSYQLNIWADHLSLNSKEHYAAAYCFLATTLGMLGTPTPEIDPYMSPDHRIYYGKRHIAMFTKDAKANFSFLRAVIENPQMTLHKMLFAPLNRDDLADAKQQVAATPNYGLGWARPDLLAECIESGNIPQDKQNTIDTATIVLIYGSEASAGQTGTSNTDTTIAVAKGLIGAVSNAANILDGLFVKAFKELDALNKTLNNITPQFNTALARYTSAQQNYDQKLQEVQSRQQSVANQQVDIQQQEQQTTTRKAELDGPINDQKQQITELNRQIYRQEISIYAQKQWLAIQNISELIGEASANTRNTTQAFAARIRLFDGQGTIPVWRALLFENQRNILGGMLKDAYIAPFKRYIDGSMVDGVLVRMPLKGLHFDDLKTLGGIVPDGQGGVNAGTTRSSVGGVSADIMPEYEGVIFARKGSELERLISELNEGDTSTPIVSSLNRDEQRQAIEQERIRLERARQQNLADQQQIRTSQTEYGRALAEEQRIRAELAAEISKGSGANQAEIARLNDALKQAEQNRLYQEHLVNNPVERLRISEQHLRVLDAEKALAEAKTRVLETQQSTDRVAIRHAEEDLDVKRGQLTTAQAELQTAINAKKALSDVLAGEKAIYDRYLNDMSIVSRDIMQQQQNMRQVVEHRLYRIANTGYFKAAIVGFQVYNFARAIEYSDGDIRGRTGIIAGFIDLGFAIEDYVAFLAKQNINETGLRKVIWNIDTNKVPRIFGAKSPFALGSAISRLAVAQSILGVVALGNSLYDVMTTAHRREDSLVRFARWLMVASSALAIIAPYFAGATFLLLTPMMWAALIIGLIAAGLIYLFQDTQLESWLKNGPFSASGTSMTHLLDPTEAYYRLIGLFAGINIDIYRTDRTVSTYQTRYGMMRQVGVSDDIRVNNHLVSLLGVKVDYKIECRYVGRALAFGVDDKIERVVETHDTQYGRRFITAPHLVGNGALSEQLWTKFKTKVQLAVNYQGKRFYFPAPTIENSNVRYTDGSRYNTPDFNNGSQPFWQEKERS